MMTTETRDARGAPSGDHLDDGRLVAIIDSAVGDSTDVGRHLDDCPHCRSRLEVIRQASARFAVAINSMPTAAIDQRTRRAIVSQRGRSRASRWAAYPMVAAATILLIASAALAAPVRQWIVRTLGGDGGKPVAETTTSPSAAPITGPDPGGMTVSFAPADTELAIRISNYQAAGTLELLRSDGASISARISASPTNEEFLIAAGTLRIRNVATSRADYQVAIPSQIKVVRLRIAGAPERVIAVGAATHESIPLTATR